MGCMGAFLEKLSEQDQASLRAYARAQADAAPPLASDQWAELYGLLWPTGAPQGQPGQQGKTGDAPGPAR